MAVCPVLLLFVTTPSLAQAPEIIDTHGHMYVKRKTGANLRGALDDALRRMDQSGIHRIIIMPTPQVGGANVYDLEYHSFAKSAYPDRVLLGGGGGSLNVMLQNTAPDEVTDKVRIAFRARAEQIVADGAVVFGEISLHHLSLANSPGGSRHPYEWVSPDHPLLLLLADIAAENNIAIDVHLDLVPQDMKLPNRRVFNPTNPALLKENMAAFNRLLAHNRDARFVWAHAGTDPLGTRNPRIQRQLLSRNSNLYMSLRLQVGKGSRKPVSALDADGKLKPQWRALLLEFPDRFVIGTDFKHTQGSNLRGSREESLQNYRAVLTQVPPQLAEAIAHGNAEKIYRLGIR